MHKSGNVEVADIIRRYGAAYRDAHPQPRNRLRATCSIEACRTAELGGHVDECDHCGTKLISYNSCRNRHCPKCQFLKKEQWIEARGKDLLPITYFHVVFTIPDDLNPLVLRNQEVLYALLFRSVSETLIELSENPKRLGAEIGFISILHTWGQNLMEHPHIHNIVSGGGLSRDGRTWKPCKKDFFLPVKMMSRLFRGKFLSYLKQLRAEEKLVYPGAASHLAQPAAFDALISNLYKKKWVVYCKPPFEKTKDVLDYLGRYTHRIAISNNRILTIENDTVSFLWRDYADGDPISPPRTGYAGKGMQFLTGVMIDPAGNVWVANNIDLMNDVCIKKVPDEAVSTRCGGNGFVEFFGLAKPVKTPVVGGQVRGW
ncbi:MAG TPA: IS91 family transposase [Nitrospiraceae bacterium]|nr:IS91 family transposase [Nitrospiraceae bacterium]